MSRALLVAAVGAAVRSTLHAWLESVESGVAALVAGTESGASGPRGAVQLKLLRLAVAPEFGGGPVVRRSRSGELLPAAEGPAGVELEYLVWAEASPAAHEEQLIGAVLEWLRRTPFVELAAGSAIPRVALTPIDLTRDEVTQLWSALGFGGRALLAFKARVAGG